MPTTVALTPAIEQAAVVPSKDIKPNFRKTVETSAIILRLPGLCSELFQDYGKKQEAGPHGPASCFSGARERLIPYHQKEIAEPTGRRS
jgi:hypothetical protein